MPGVGVGDGNEGGGFIESCTATGEGATQAEPLQIVAVTRNEKTSGALAAGPPETVTPLMPKADCTAAAESESKNEPLVDAPSWSISDDIPERDALKLYVLLPLEASGGEPPGEVQAIEL